MIIRKRPFLKLIVIVLLFLFLQPVLSSCGQEKSEVENAITAAQAAGTLSQEIQPPEVKPILNTDISKITEYGFDEELSALFALPDDY
ncbi:MAG: hypothetical protein HGA22_07145, partial [Clostridiales bacterium]|nr:hypothetical protein [Clostridiales bacterium]